jgi:hypothetical protein
MYSGRRGRGSIRKYICTIKVQQETNKLKIK